MAAGGSAALYTLESYLDSGKTWTDAEETQLNLLLSFSASKIINRAYPFREDVTEVPSQYENLQIRLAAELYARMGAEGQTVHNENGINRTWESSEAGQVMLREIVPEVGIL